MVTACCRVLGSRPRWAARPAARQHHWPSPCQLCSPCVQATRQDPGPVPLGKQTAVEAMPSAQPHACCSSTSLRGMTRTAPAAQQAEEKCFLVSRSFAFRLQASDQQPGRKKNMLDVGALLKRGSGLAEAAEHAKHVR